MREDIILQYLDKVPMELVFFGVTLSVYPLSRFVLPHVKSVNLACLIHIIMGMLVAVWTCRKDTIIAVGFTLIGYFLIYMPPIAASLIAFCINMACHILVYRRGISWALDVTGFTMVLFQKIMSLSFNINDARQIKSGINIGRKRWVDVAILDVPFLEYLAYAFTPFGSYSNPFIEFKAFQYILRRGTRPEPTNPRDRSMGRRRFYGSFLYAAVAIPCMKILTYDFYTSELYFKFPAIVRLVILIIRTIFLVIRYFPAWWLVESGFYETGVMSSGIVPEDELSNLSMLETLRSPTSKEWMRRWNHTVHIFWKNYLFTRLLKAGCPASIGNDSVFIASSMWHGVRPVFYLMLPETFLLMKADDMLNEMFPQKDSDPLWLKVAHNIFVAINMLYATSTWYFPTYAQFMHIKKSVLFIPSIVAIAIIIAVSIMRPKSKKEKKE